MVHTVPRTMLHVSQTHMKKGILVKSSQDADKFLVFDQVVSDRFHWKTRSQESAGS